MMAAGDSRCFARVREVSYSLFGSIIMLGIDVSKDTLACTLFDTQTQKPIWHRTVPNTNAGINRLLRQTPTQSHWTLEPTGRYGLLAVTTARQAGRQVLLAQSTQRVPEGTRLSALHPEPRQD